MSKLISLIGKKFGRLVIVKKVNSGKPGYAKLLCLCSCGKKTIVFVSNLKSGNTKSCGCLRKEISTKIKTKHGYKKRNRTSRTYQSWASMIKRCTNPNDQAYDNYGGRGIMVCDRWKKFENFLEDMGDRPENKSIDRIDSNNNYCKSNCRWATCKQQSRNTRKNRLITFRGKTQCISAWAEELHIKTITLHYRICRYGWSIKKALITPVRQRGIKNGR